MKVFTFILKVLITVAVFVWIVVVFTDYFRVRLNKEPMFCITERTIDYNDGSTYVCVGAGYKTIRYNRSCLKATEFGPYVLKERTC